MRQQARPAALVMLPREALSLVALCGGAAARHTLLPLRLYSTWVARVRARQCGAALPGANWPLQVRPSRE